MTVLDTKKVSKDLLERLHYTSVEDAGLSMLHLSCMAKISEYKSDDERYEKKYKSSFAEFSKKINQQMNEEDFEEEDDLLAWQYAHDARTYWENKLQELNTCC